MSLDFGKLRAVLYSAVLSDTLDSFGRMNQAMRPFIRPVDDAIVLLGRARTGRYEPVDGIRSGENPYEVEITLVDDLRPDDVVVLACDGPTERIAPWGELLSTAAKYREAAGCITDGLVRDVRSIRNLSFPVFHGGIGPLDTKGRACMTAMDVTVTCGGVEVSPGDLVFGDVDGVGRAPAGDRRRSGRCGVGQDRGRKPNPARARAGLEVGRSLRAPRGALTGDDGGGPLHAGDGAQQRFRQLSAVRGLRGAERSAAPRKPHELFPVDRLDIAPHMSGGHVLRRRARRWRSRLFGVRRS